jgi:hypothetical protein
MAFVDELKAFGAELADESGKRLKRKRGARKVRRSSVTGAAAQLRTLVETERFTDPAKTAYLTGAQRYLTRVKQAAITKVDHDIPAYRNEDRPRVRKRDVNVAFAFVKPVERRPRGSLASDVCKGLIGFPLAPLLQHVLEAQIGSIFDILTLSKISVCLALFGLLVWLGFKPPWIRRDS